jgi:hypothetical protein
MAALGRRYLRFLRPEDQARFEALSGAVSRLSLAEATSAIDRGQVTDSATGRPVEWAPIPMVFPLSHRLRMMVEGTDYESAVVRARAGLHFRLHGNGERTGGSDRSVSLPETVR